MDIPGHCSEIQRERIESYLSMGWVIEKDDGINVFIKKEFSYLWVKRDGYIRVSVM